LPGSAARWFESLRDEASPADRLLNIESLLEGGPPLRQEGLIAACAYRNYTLPLDDMRESGCASARALLASIDDVDVPSIRLHTSFGFKPQ
jgi:hypothetical protein